MYLSLLPVVVVSPFAGVLIYYWLDWLPPDAVYSVTLIPNYLSFTTGALAFVVWLFREKKEVPRAPLVILLMAAYLVWINVTWLSALAPGAGWFDQDRTLKVVGFSILAAQMLKTRGRLEAFVWAFALATIYFAVPSAIKVVVSGGAGGIGTGDVVAAAGGSFFGDRVALSVVMAMTLPFALYLGRQATLLPPRWLRWVKPAMYAVVACFLLASIGTFARTAVFATGATLLMLALRARRKFAALLILGVTVLVVLAIAPDEWFGRMDTIVDYQHDYSALDRISAWRWAWAMALSHPIVGGGFGVFTLDAGFIAGRPGWLEAHNILFEVMAEHGFVGLGLFCWIIAAIYRSCAVVQKRVRGREELAWTADLARATQVALVAFIAGGMFISIASNPFIFMLAGITVGTRNFVERQLTAGRARPVPGAASPALQLAK